MRTITISDETWEKIKGQVEKEKKFEPISIHHDCFVVDVAEATVKITTGSGYADNGCYQSSFTVRRFIKALQAAADYIGSK